MGDILKKIDCYLKEDEFERLKRFFVLDSDSTVNTANPTENEYVVGWKNEMTYILIKSPRYTRPFILAGS